MICYGLIFVTQDVVELLLEAGAEVNKGNHNGTRAIHLAAYRDNIIGLEKLLKAPDIDIHVSRVP